MTEQRNKNVPSSNFVFVMAEAAGVQRIESRQAFSWARTVRAGEAKRLLKTRLKIVEKEKL